MAQTKNTVSCESIENHQVLIRSGAHAWVADEPPALGGDGLAPNPFDLLLGALGSCIVITVGHYAGQARIPLEGLWVDLAGEQSAPDAKYRIAVLLRVRGNLADQDVERLRRAAERCPVHHILGPGADIATEIRRV